MAIKLSYNSSTHEIHSYDNITEAVVLETGNLSIEVHTTEGSWNNSNSLYYSQEETGVSGIAEAEAGVEATYNIPVMYLASGDLKLAVFDAGDNQLTNLFTVTLKKLTVSGDPVLDPFFKMDNNKRRLLIPGTQGLLAIQYDNVSEYVDFEIPRYQDTIDLSTKICYVNYKRPQANDLGKALASITVSDEEYVHVTWLVDKNVTAFEGMLEFQLEFTDEQGFYRWQSQIGKLPIVTSLYNTGLEPYAPTFLENMLEQMQETASDSEAYATGRRNGQDVESGDPAYHNNAKYYAEQASQAGGSGGSASLPGLGSGYVTANSQTATTRARTADATGFIRTTGGIVNVKWPTGINTTNPTLNINATGAAAIYLHGAAVPSGTIKAGDITTLVFDGTRYNIIQIDDAVSKALKAYQIPDTGIPATDLADGVIPNWYYFTTETGYSAEESNIPVGSYILIGISQISLFKRTSTGKTVMCTWPVGSSGGGGESTTEVLHINITRSGNAYVSDTAESVILAAIAENKLIYAQTPNGVAYYSYDDEGCVFFCISGTSQTSQFAIWRFVVDGTSVTMTEIDAVPLIVHITEQNGDLMSDVSETSILSAVAAGREVIVETPNGRGYYYNDDDGATFFVITGSSTARSIHRYVIDGTSVSRTTVLLVNAGRIAEKTNAMTQPVGYDSATGTFWTEPGSGEGGSGGGSSGPAIPTPASGTVQTPSVDKDKILTVDATGAYILKTVSSWATGGSY